MTDLEAQELRRENEYLKRRCAQLTADVTDLTSQASAFGDLRHAIAAGAMKAGAVYGELADVVGGTLPGRMNDSDRFVFDSTGVAIEDLAAAQMIYSYGLADPAAMRVRLGGGT